MPGPGLNLPSGTLWVVVPTLGGKWALGSAVALIWLRHTSSSPSWVLDTLRQWGSGTPALSDLAEQPEGREPESQPCGGKAPEERMCVHGLLL